MEYFIPKKDLTNPMPNTVEHLRWRYATKRYDATKKLSDEQRQIIMESLRLAPSSFGLQPWKFVHVTNPALREKLKVAAFDQPQLTEASDLFILCSKTSMDEAQIDVYLKSIADQRQVPPESLAGFRQTLIHTMTNRSAADLTEWNARQTYIALGVALAAAAENQIDATPMEGFDAAQFDKILDLEKLGFRSRAILAVGFRSPEDAFQHLAKVRFDQKDVFLER